jgi:hypothetical protein
VFVSFVVIDSCQEWIITPVARFLDRSGSNSFIVLWDITHAAFLQLFACKEPPCDGVED